MRFRDRRVLVTGASGGIGRAICRAFAAEGARVGMHYRTGLDAVTALRDDLEGDGHHVVAADLTEPAAVEAMVTETAEALGGLDVLVNNAGIFERHPPREVDYAAWQAHWRQTLDVNLVAAANASFCAARRMAEGGGGRIVNVTSRGAFRGEPECPAYGASKAGLNALSQSLAVALAPDEIYVFAVAPGFVETAMARPYLTGEMAESIKQQSPLGRVARADDIAYWVLAMAADGAEYATGTIIDVNGASYLRS